MSDDIVINLDSTGSHFIISVTKLVDDKYMPVIIKTISEDERKEVHQISMMYQSLITLRSFINDDAGAISFAQDLGKHIYSLFFKDIEYYFESCSSLHINCDMFIIPFELAFDGNQFFGQKYALSNWIKTFGDISSNKYQYTAKSSGAPCKVLFIGIESDEIIDRCIYRAVSTNFENAVNIKAKELINKLELSKYDILHFAGHGNFIDDNPEQSFLILNRDGANESELTLLKYEQLKGKKFNHKIVFLNACNSGRLDNDYRYLTRFADILFKSGVKDYITPVWPVSDEIAIQFAASFYKYLFNGIPISEALRNTRREFVKNDECALTGLSYILFGDPSTMIYKCHNLSPLCDRTNDKKTLKFEAESEHAKFDKDTIASRFGDLRKKNEGKYENSNILDTNDEFGYHACPICWQKKLEIHHDKSEAAPEENWSTQRLIEATKAENLFKRACGSLNLPKRQPPEELEVMIRAMKDKRYVVKMNAMTRIADMGIVVFDRILEALSDPEPDIRAGAAWIMGQLKDPRSIAALEKTAKDNYPLARIQAKSALKSIRSGSQEYRSVSLH